MNSLLITSKSSGFETLFAPPLNALETRLLHGVFYFSGSVLFG